MKVQLEGLYVTETNGGLFKRLEFHRETAED